MAPLQWHTIAILLGAVTSDNLNAVHFNSLEINSAKIFQLNIVQQVVHAEEIHRSEFVNEYVDLLLIKVNNALAEDGHDIECLPSFNKRFKGIVWNYNISLENGFVFGLNKIKRMSDVKMKYHHPTISTCIQFGYDTVEYDYDHITTYRGIESIGAINATIRDYRWQIKLDFDTTTSTLVLQEYKVEDFGRTKTNFHGGLPDSLFNVRVERILQPLLKRIIGSFVTILTETTIKAYNKQLED